MKCGIYSNRDDDKLVECGKQASVKLIFLDDSLMPVCPKCFYEQIVDGSAIGFITDDGWRVDFAYTKPT